MKTGFLILCMLFVFQINAQERDTTIIDSSIDRVTVFFNGAEVERTARVTLPRGTTTIKAEGLAYQLNPKSIQVKGSDNLSIISVRHETRQPRYTSNSAEAERITSESEKLRFQVSDLQNQIYVLGQEEMILMENRNLKNEKGGTSVSDIQTAAEFYRQRLNQIRRLMLDHNQTIASINKEITRLNNQLNNLNPENKKYTSEVFITVESKSPTPEKLVIRYFVPAAGWKPEYEFRVDDVSKPLRIVYKATIFQTTGEDWNHAKISLSSGNPVKTTGKPVLLPWYFNQPQPVNIPSISFAGSTLLQGQVTDQQSGDPLAYANVVVTQEQQYKYGAATDPNGFFALHSLQPGYYELTANYIGYQQSYPQSIYLAEGQQLNQNIVLQPVVQTLAEVKSISAVSDSYTSYDDMSVSYSASAPVNVNYINSTEDIAYRVKAPEVRVMNLISNQMVRKVSELEYQIETPVTINGNGREVAVRIKEVSTPADYIYHTVPQIDPDVFLMAGVPGWSKLDLLTGPATIFFENTFVGETSLDITKTTDTLQISLGRDKNIVVERKSDKIESGRKTFGKTVRDLIGWEVTVKNNRQTEIRLVVEEQIPVSNSPEIKINMIRHGDAKYNNKNGFLKWETTLLPAGSKKLNYQYEIEYPEQVRLNYY
jgi:hypothetical protein